MFLYFYAPCSKLFYILVIQRKQLSFLLRSRDIYNRFMIIGTLCWVGHSPFLFPNFFTDNRIKISINMWFKKDKFIRSRLSLYNIFSQSVNAVYDYHIFETGVR